MTTSPLAKKLLIKPGMTVLVLHAPDGYRALLKPLPEGVVLAEAPANGVDVVLLFVRSRAEVNGRLPRAAAAGKPDGLLWVAYPKGGVKAGTDLNRDILHAAAEGHGLIGVSLVAVDDTWSAMRFRRPERVGS